MKKSLSFYFWTIIIIVLIYYVLIPIGNFKDGKGQILIYLILGYFIVAYYEQYHLARKKLFSLEKEIIELYSGDLDEDEEESDRFQSVVFAAKENGLTMDLKNDDKIIKEIAKSLAFWATFILILYLIF